MLTGSCFQYWARKGVSDVNLSETEEEDEKRVSLKKKKKRGAYIEHFSQEAEEPIVVAKETGAAGDNGFDPLNAVIVHQDQGP